MAQELFLPPAGSPVSLSAPVMPLLLRGMKVDARDPLHMNFLVDQGHGAVSDDVFKDESLRLIKYFLAALTIPEKDLWVNLSPYESDRIIQDDFGRTGMGRDLLAQDYILKQLTAGLLHPDGTTGKVFWAEVYKRAYDQYGTTAIPVDTFNKVWILPAKSVVYESRSPDGENISAFVQEMNLKVMLETDYLAQALPTGGHVPQSVSSIPLASDSELAKDILRQIVIPVLEKEVNEGANFALLRQVCYSLILSVWLKKKLMASVAGVQESPQHDPRTTSILAQIFVDRHKTQGVEITDAQAQTKLIYDRYVEAFKRGAYDLIKEEVDTYSQELIPRKYFSGGFDPSEVGRDMELRSSEDFSEKMGTGNYRRVDIGLKPASVEKMTVEGNTVVWENLSPKRPRSFWKKKMTLVMAGVLLGMAVLRSDSTFISEPVVSPEQTISLSTEDVKKYIVDVTDNKQAFETGLIAEEAAGIELKAFLGGMLRERMDKGFTLEEQDSVVNGWGGELATIFNNNFDRFGKDLKDAGLSVVDVFRLLMAMAGKESGGDMLAVQMIDGKIQARAALQIEYATWWHQLHITQSELKNMPLEFQKFYTETEDFYQRVTNEIKKPKGSASKNEWNSNGTDDLVALTETHIRMAIIRLNYMLKARPLPLTAILSDEDRKFTEKVGIDLPSEIRAQLPDSVPFLKDVVNDILKVHAYEKAGIYMGLIPMGWNGGINQIDTVLKKNLEVMQQPYEKIADYLKGTNLAEAEAEKTRVEAEARVKASVPVKVRGLVNSLFKSNNRSETLVRIYKQLKTKELKKAFVDSWFAYREVERNKILADGFNNPKPMAYALVIKSFLNDDKGAAKKLGNNYRWILRNKPDTFQNDRKVLGPEKKVSPQSQHKKVSPAIIQKNVNKAQELKRKVTNAKAKKKTRDRSEINGGIDLTGQSNAVEVWGQSGAFGLNLAPEQIKALDQDLRGFLPLIINIQPVKDVKMFLGFQNASGDLAGS
jgi:hypothetical protein